MDAGSSTDSLLIALSGGAIGAVLAAVGWTLLRIVSIPGDLASHDFQMRVLNEDLELWAADSYRDLKIQLAITEASYPEKIRRFGTDHGRTRASVKSAALHRWRDRRHKAERELAAITAQEGWMHRFWRRCASGYPNDLGLPALQKVEPIIDEFRQPVTKHGSPPIQVFDPTAFELGDLVATISRRPLEPAVPPRFERKSDGGGGWIDIVHNEPEPETPDLSDRKASDGS